MFEVSMTAAGNPLTVTKHGRESGAIARPVAHRLRVAASAAHRPASSGPASLPGRRSSLSHVVQRHCAGGARRNGRRHAAVVAEASDSYIVNGDIGGTNARLQVWKVNGGSVVEQVFQEIFPTKDFDSFPAVLAKMQSQLPAEVKISVGCFAVAGAVVDQKCTMTNLGWEINGPELAKEFGYKVGILNDFEAVGYGVRCVDDDYILKLNDVPAVEKAPVAVLGPGTGLGEAQLFWDDSQGAYKVYPSEGSHADFAPRGWKQRALSQFVEHKLGFCEVESVGCGSGLERIYAFLISDEGPHSEDLLQYFTANWESNKPIPLKNAPEISKGALDGTCSISREAVDMMLSIIGAEASHMALRSLARGGVYIAGGITPKVIDRLHFGGLLEAFLSKKARFFNFLKTVPLTVILDEKVGLLGSREYGIQMLSK
mmetsp:Transcript_39538/g.112112  ORF Transcript_39538/g.112112 Transcript_39538/m.112112 type:complete len:428 (+) Transcript_39538:359-1642(+)